ncbi:MAG: mannosyltransferase, partial [Solirubrobacteraceae bacterium]|nr:mannosyltransferase [Solirubrobacteraceae bacterium]
MSTATETQAAPRTAAHSRALPEWWPLAALVVLAAALRLSTLGLQSFWFDEAFTPVNVLHPSLFKTLHAITQTENSPPLWYIVEWVDYRILGTGEWA